MTNDVLIVGYDNCASTWINFLLARVDDVVFDHFRYIHK